MALGRFPYPTVRTIFFFYLFCLVVVVIVLFLFIYLFIYLFVLLFPVLISYFAEARNCFNVLVYH